MKDLWRLFLVLTFAYLTFSGYESYKHNLYEIGLHQIHGEKHYRYKQMVSADMLCRDEQDRLCFCGHCD
ncbi:MAG: hypothetical protein HY714_05330 [Candidatus Omnitrophica bacterium]|nr:hypothetical protein [Candidatus Omnitrophota bacterium]